MSQTSTTLRYPIRCENAAFAKAALIYRVERRLRRFALLAAALGALLAPMLTGSLRDLCERPMLPFGGVTLASTRGEMLLLCAKFADVGVPCDTTKLDPDTETAYIPAPKLDVGEILLVIRDAILGLAAPVAVLLALWFSWRSYLELAAV